MYTIDLPELKTIFDLEDEIRRTENQLKVQRWAHRLLLVEVKRDPQARPYKIIVARLEYRLKRLLHLVSTRLSNW